MTRGRFVWCACESSYKRSGNSCRAACVGCTVLNNEARCPSHYTQSSVRLQKKSKCSFKDPRQRSDCEVRGERCCWCWGNVPESTSQPSALLHTLSVSLLTDCLRHAPPSSDWFHAYIVLGLESSVGLAVSLISCVSITARIVQVLNILEMLWSDILICLFPDTFPNNRYLKSSTCEKCKHEDKTFN